MESAPHDDTSNQIVEVRLCDWHLRRIFWDERIWERYYTHELDCLLGPLIERRNPTSSAKGKYNQEWIFTDPRNGNTQVARCHTFVEEDGETIAGSGLPDPKNITWRGFDYHLVQKGGMGCEHCAAGISTWPSGDPVS